jgi:hypothetical protein
MDTGTLKALTAALAATATLFAPVSEARVTGITIASTTPLFGGVSLGAAGAYEQIRGTVRGELDPFSRHNDEITDIRLAPRNARGMVEYTATFTIHKPVDMSRASGVMVYEVVNRGNKILPGFFTVGASPTSPQGDAFLYRTGNLYLWSGWQGDVAFNPAGTLETIQVPVVTGVTGPTFARFVAGIRQHAAASRRGPHAGEPGYHQGEADLDRPREQSRSALRRGRDRVQRLGIRRLRHGALPGRAERRACVSSQRLRSRARL